MNERIQQLALEAGLVRNGDWGMKRWEGPRSDSINDQDLEKFAELIVAECIATVKKRYMGDNNREDMEVRRCVADIQTHFGVEQ